MRSDVKKLMPEQYLRCEKQWVFRLMIFVAGIYGGYTLSVRGGVFCNAQTGNMALLALALGNGNWEKALYYLVPVCGYMLGTIISELIPKPLRRLRLMRWDTLLMLIEIVAVIVIGLIPAGSSDRICQIMINFICAMQYNTFRQGEGIPLATTFCTNHTRQFGAALVGWLRRKEDSAQQGRKAAANGLMLLSFMAGVLVSALMCRWLGIYAIWTALVPLGILFIQLLRADLTAEKDLLEVTPQGH